MKTISAPFAACLCVAVTVRFATTELLADTHNQSPVVDGSSIDIDISQAPAAVALISNSILSSTGSFDQAQLCEGTVIGARWVLTAADCVVDNGSVAPAADFSIHMGSTDLEAPLNQAIGVTRVITHQQFKSAIPSNDIALLELENDSLVRPASNDIQTITLNIHIVDIGEDDNAGMVLENNRIYNLYIPRGGNESHREDIALDELSSLLNMTPELQTITEPEMASINGGTYSMGCSRGDSQCEAYEKPAHPVHVTPYTISVTEVTVGQFDQFVTDTDYVTDAERDAGGDAGCFIWSDHGGISRSTARWAWEEDKNWRNPGYQQSVNHPVTCISWNDANNYANWLAAKTGRDYSLPSEAQWELAARASSSGPWGSALSSGELCAYANVADKSESITGSKWNNRVNCTDDHWFSAPVASYKANDFGIFDMQGNAWEWVADTWGDSFSGSQLDGVPNTQGSQTERVLRGGSWDSGAERARISSRSKAGATGRAAMTGFRLVLEQKTQ